MADAQPDLAPIYEAAGKEWNVDPRLLQAQGLIESGGNVATPDSPAGAQGVAQIMPATGAALGVTNARDPAQAIFAQAKLMRQNLDTYKNPADALRAYNAGTDQAKWGNPETMAYVPKVAAAYAKLASPPAAPAAAPAAPPPVSTDAAPASPYAAMSPDDFFAATTGEASAPSSDGVNTITVTANRPPPAAVATPSLDATMAKLRAAQAPVTASQAATPAPEAQAAPAASYATMAPDDFFAATTGTKTPSVVASAPSAAASIAPAAATPSTQTPVASAAAAPTTQAPSAPAVDARPSWLEKSLNTTAGTLNAITHGLSMGLDRPVNALGQAALRYIDPAAAAAWQKVQDQGKASFEAAHPVANVFAETAGSVPAYLSGEGALLKAVPRIAGSGALVGIGNALLTGARNATMGGVSGYGLSGGDVGGAETGAALGLVVPPAVHALGVGVNALASPFINRTAAGAASSAARKVAGAIARDQMAPEEVATNLARLGPNAALVDAGGANLRGLGETVANMPGAPAQQAETFLEGRMSGQHTRLNNAVTAATGSTGDFHAALDQLSAQRAADAAPKYEAAFSQSPVTSKEIRPLQRFIQDPIGQEALQRGLRIVQLEKLAEGKAFNPEIYGVKPGQDGGFIIDPGLLRMPDGKISGSASVPSLRMLDAVKRGYDDIVEGFRDKTTGRLDLNQYGHAVNNVRAALVGELREMYPAYADALDAWAGPSRAKDALSMGRRALSNDPEVTAKVIARLPDSDKEFFKAGVARALKDKIDSAQDGADATRRIFGNDLIRSKIQAAFNDPAAFADFENTMQREAAFARTRNEVLRGSQTARRLAGQQDTGVDVTTPLFHTVTGNFGHAAMNVFQQAAEAMKRPPGKQGVELGNMLFSPGANAGTLDALATVRANPLLRSYLARAGILGGVNMLAPSAGQ